MTNIDIKSKLVKLLVLIFAFDHVYKSVAAMCLRAALAPGRVGGSGLGASGKIIGGRPTRRAIADYCR
jgi:hypothetical protein